jgi:hypothetical protein
MRQKIQGQGRPKARSLGALKGAGFEATRNSTQQAQPEERRFGATRRFTAGIAGRCGKRGNPNSHQPASRGKRSFGATRGFNLGKAGRLRTWADPGTDREAALEGEDSGEPGNSTPGSTNDARFGAHRKSITGKSRKASVRGNSRARWEAVLVQRICGATRVSKASSAEGCEIRGNSKLHCRHGLKMQGAGRPATTSEAQHEERRRGDARGFTSGSVAGSDFEATRRNSPGAEWTMYGSIDLSGHQG